MTTCKTTLPGISFIAYTSCANLPDHLALKAKAGATPIVATTYDAIPFVAAECVNVSSYDTHDRSETATLSFDTIVDIPENIPIAFLVRAVDGKSYIIGAKELPYPIVSLQQKKGLPDGDSNVTHVEVTLTSFKAFITCFF